MGCRRRDPVSGGGRRPRTRRHALEPGLQSETTPGRHAQPPGRHQRGRVTAVNCPPIADQIKGGTLAKKSSVSCGLAAAKHHDDRSGTHGQAVASR